MGEAGNCNLSAKYEFRAYAREAARLLRNGDELWQPGSGEAPAIIRKHEEGGIPISWEVFVHVCA